LDFNNNKLAVERLTALWALNECGLGGFMHALSSPFTGIIVGGISILLLSLIALYSENTWSAIFKALCVVLLVKLGVSPHTPIGAYVAVSFQALFAALVYSLFHVKLLTTVLLGGITFLESAIQKLIVLTIVYGQSLWEAINVYGAYVSEKMEFLPLALSSKTLSLLFISFYFSVGVLAGFLISKTIALIKDNSTTEDIYIPKHSNLDIGITKKCVFSKKAPIFWAVTLLLVCIPLVFFNTKYGGLEKGMYLVARSVSILLIWYLLLAPLSLRWLRKLLSNRSGQYKLEVQNTLDLLPYLQDIVLHAWGQSKSLKGFERIQNFMVKSIVYSIYFNRPK